MPFQPKKPRLSKSLSHWGSSCQLEDAKKIIISLFKETLYVRHAIPVEYDILFEEIDDPTISGQNLRLGSLTYSELLNFEITYK